MPRPKKERHGEKPQWRKTKNAWVARVWEQDGSCSGWVELGSNRELAVEAYERWLATGERPTSERGKEVFRTAAARIVDAAEKDGAIEPELAKDRRTRLRLYALPSLGHLEVARLESHHVASVLDGMAKEHQKSAGYILKMRSDISQILSQLRREGAVRDNCARHVELPATARVDTRERRSLTDDQLLEFQRQRGFTRPLDLMILFSRGIGGHRTSDEHAAEWEEVDLEGFAWMKVRRPKTDEDVGAAIKAGKRRVRAYEKVSHEIDPEYRPHLRAYWEAQGQPTSGPIFPLLRDGVAAPMKLKDGRIVARRPSRAGGHKNRGTSYAAALRRAVWECGIYDPDPRKPWDPEHPEKECCRFQTDTPTTKRLDFHSFRRDLNTALMDAGTATATQLAVMGHTQLSTGLRHYAGKRRVRVPDAALPGRAGKQGAGKQGAGKGGPGLPVFTPEQREALAELLGLGGGASGGGPSGGQPGAALSRETLRESGRIPGSGRKLRSEGSHMGVQVVDIARAPESIRTTDPRFRNASDASASSVTAGNPVRPESAHQPLTTGFLPEPGRIGKERAELLAQAAVAVLRGDWAEADRLRALVDALPLASVHTLSVARTRRR